MTYYDRLNETFKAFEQMNLRPATQLVQLHLLHINNCLGNPGQFYCSDDHLATLTNLSKDSITKAKRHLKNAGFIDFKSSGKRRGTLYILPEKQAIKQAINQSKKQAIPQADSICNVLNFNNKKEKEAENTPAPATFNNHCNSVEVQETWFKCEGEAIPYAMAQTLYELEKLHGVEFAKDVVFTASAENKQPKITLNYLKTIANNKLKGGEKVGKVESEDWEGDRPDWLGRL